MKRLETSTTEPFAPVLSADHAPVNAVDVSASSLSATAPEGNVRALRRARRAARFVRRSIR